ncbi:Lipoprotein-releasing system ATP-binding protein LolD [Bacteroidales bacterium CF]|jgi:ABC-type antimicrobial peptide transport system, ATPase component|nr:Lipoprotein-releasing system ATP-binding protein LolD [Bacteroidales bacterium CF]
MIRAENVKKSFGNLQVLKGISLETKEAEVLSIVGASGAGKSTLLQILGSLSVPDSGKVYIDNTDVFALGSNAISDFRNKRIGFVFQFHHLLPEFTSLENVIIPAIIAKESMRSAKDRAKHLLSSLGLGDRLSHKPGELSGGEQQRVAIARALINRPSVIFADEPSGNLDTVTKKEIHSLFFDLRDRYNQTIIIVTHDRDLAAMSDRILEMRDGEFI